MTAPEDVPGARLAADLAALLRDARTASGESLTAVATRAGVHPNSLRELEAGVRGDGRPVNPTLERVAKAADAYGLTVTLTCPTRRRRKATA